jgi:hypothetical protein
METDRDLLEAAARAAGIRLEWDGPPSDWVPMYYEGKTYHGWNPLEDDGDALRLAVKLRFDILPSESSVLVFRSINHPRRVQAEENFGDDPYAATRRAIVRAAASLQETK